MNRLIEQLLQGAVGGGKDATNKAFKATSPDGGKTWVDANGNNVTQDYANNGNTNPVRNPTFGEKALNPEYANQLETQRNQFSLDPAFSQQKFNTQQGLTEQGIATLRKSGLLSPDLAKYSDTAISTVMGNNPDGLTPAETERQLMSQARLEKGIIAPAAQGAVNTAKLEEGSTGQALKDQGTNLQTQHEQSVGANFDSRTGAALSQGKYQDVNSLLDSQRFNDQNLIPAEQASQLANIMHPVPGFNAQYAMSFDPVIGQRSYGPNPYVSNPAQLKSATAAMGLNALGYGGQTQLPNGTIMPTVADGMGGQGQYIDMTRPAISQGAGSQPAALPNGSVITTPLPMKTGRTGGITPTPYNTQQQYIDPDEPVSSAVARGVVQPTIRPPAVQQTPNPINQPSLPPQRPYTQSVDSPMNQQGIIPSIASGMANAANQVRTSGYNTGYGMSVPNQQFAQGGFTPISASIPTPSQLRQALFSPSPQTSAPLPITQGMSPEMLANYQKWLEQQSQQAGGGQTNLIPTSASAF